MRTPVSEFVPLPVNESPGASWMRYAGLVETGDPSSSESVDETVYATNR